MILADVIFCSCYGDCPFCDRFTAGVLVPPSYFSLLLFPFLKVCSLCVFKGVLLFHN